MDKPMQRIAVTTMTFTALAVGLVMPGQALEPADAQTPVVHSPKRVSVLQEKIANPLKASRWTARIEARKERARQRRIQAREAAREQAAAQAAAQAQESSAPAPAPSSSSVSGNRALGQQMMLAAGWGMDQWACLDALWTRESGWNERAYNPSGAYGIPQALPGSKMATAGSDWQTNPATQIRWGLSYLRGRYGSPCGGWDHSQAYGWY